MGGGWQVWRRIGVVVVVVVVAKFSRRQPQCHPAHGNFSHGLPACPKLSKGTAPRRRVLRAARARADDRHRVKKVGSNP